MNGPRIVFGCILTVIAGAVEAQPSQQEWALTHVHLVSPCENQSWGPAALWIHGAHTVALDSLHTLEIPARVERHDVGGACAIPGLVDSHFHISKAIGHHRRSIGASPAWKRYLR